MRRDGAVRYRRCEETVEIVKIAKTTVLKIKVERLPEGRLNACMRFLPISCAVCCLEKCPLAQLFSFALTHFPLRSRAFCPFFKNKRGLTASNFRAPLTTIDQLRVSTDRHKNLMSNVAAQWSTLRR